MGLWAQLESTEVQLIALAFEHTYCVARQCGKVSIFHSYGTSQDQRRGLTDPWSVKLFTTNWCCTTTKCNMQSLNANKIDSNHKLRPNQSMKYHSAK